MYSSYSDAFVCLLFYPHTNGPPIHCKPNNIMIFGPTYQAMAEEEEEE